MDLNSFFSYPIRMRKGSPLLLIKKRNFRFSSSWVYISRKWHIHKIPFRLIKDPLHYLDCDLWKNVKPLYPPGQKTKRKVEKRINNCTFFLYVCLPFRCCVWGHHIKRWMNLWWELRLTGKGSSFESIIALYYIIIWKDPRE